MNKSKAKKNGRIRSADDLRLIRDEMSTRIAMRQLKHVSVTEDAASGKSAKKGRHEIMLCMGTSCISSGAVGVRDALQKAITSRKLTSRVKIVETGCNGFCAGGPIMVVYPGGYFYQKVTAEDAGDIVAEHIVKGKPVERLMYRHPVTDQVIPFYGDIPFFAQQDLEVLKNKGVIAAESVRDYIGRDGYAALARALVEMTPEDIIDEIKKSGLRGRGGAGFPTGLKWEFCRRAEGDCKFILCNADEGDPGAFMDRSLIESDPHAVLEGMMIAGRAIGAEKGFIYCRAEYPLAVKRLNRAIEDCRKLGLLGSDIMGSGFNLDIEVAQGSGAFVCGEETALMRSVEGKRGEPRPRPPFPANRGLWEKPSVLNNVETFGNIPLIIRKGSAKYVATGTKRSPGTKIFALTGKVKNVGLIEVPMGTPLGALIYDIGGGIPDGKAYKAAQIGGPSGGCVPKQHLNVPLDYESLDELGAIMGSGGLVVMDEDTCMVDVARYFLEFVQEESCGKCAPGRVGTRRMLEILERICEGKGEEGDIERLETLGRQIKDTALCGLGQTAPNPVLSTIRHFRDEYVAHIRDKKCPAGVCAALVRAPCQNACPAGVDVPGFVSLVAEKRYSEALRHHRERNPFAAVCASVCFHPCEAKCRRATLDNPLAVRSVKRFMVETEKKPVLPEVRIDKENAGKKIAVVGAGPAGLSCAYFLARMGYKPTVFEAHDRAGGMLVQTIPAYRLPRKMLAREVAMIEGMGVRIKTGRKLGRDFTLNGLRKKGYQAVFLGLGAPAGMAMGLESENMPGVADGIRFLREYNMSGKTEVGGNVVVIGGGNVAVDVARTALRLGAEKVTVLYRRTREQMPAYAEEVHDAESEGVDFDFLVAPHGLVEKNGRVVGLRCKRMRLSEFDSSGRRRPVEIPDSEFVVEADQVVSAIGQRPEGKEVLGMKDLKLTSRGYVEADPVTGRTSVDWIFAGGDGATGPASVIDAIAAGERAAVGIDASLSEEPHVFWREEIAVNTAFDPDADPVSWERHKAKMLPVKKRTGSFDQVEVPWAERTAIREARRCLRCDYRDECTA